ncbi:MAG TPA: NAD(P)H-binding protein [Blastocatellia bacterium]|nr:NAD(P)H-binding protein [Blastocatellia bacterium]
MIVVTGATGNSGSVVARALLTKERRVRVIGRSAARLEPLVEEGAEAFVCNLTDAERLGAAFAGANAVYVMEPPNVTSNDYRAYQDRIADTAAGAIEMAGVKYAVSLSSVGADKPDGTGPVVGQYYLEQRLNRIPGLNTLHLRAGYLMENTLIQAGVIPALGVVAGPLSPELKIPMVAARDAGAAAADALLRLDFNGHETRELLGERDITMAEAASIIGSAIGRPDLAYLQIPDDQLRPALVQAGISENVADLILEMAGAMNSGRYAALEERSPWNTTPTSFETFVAQEFVRRYHGIAARESTGKPANASIS